MSARTHLFSGVLVLCLITAANADQVVFKNGDKISGQVETLDSGQLKIKSAVAGEITVDMKDVATFSTDHPVDIVTSDHQKLHEQIAAGDADHIKAGNTVLDLAALAKINPPEQKWTGTIVANGAIARGNTNTDDFGIAVNAMLRRIDEERNVNDRLTLNGNYNIGRQKDAASGEKITTTDNWMTSGKYDRFWTPKFYGYGLMEVDHDRIAALNYRLSPGVGLGYQWVEKPEFNFFTEAGVSYVFEKYTNDGNDDRVALRLAYHFDKKLNDTVSVFHDLEWLPAFDDPSDYNLNVDAGLRANLTKTMFAEFKFLWNRDSTPAPGAEKNDLKYLLGVGWTF